MNAAEPKKQPLTGRDAGPPVPSVVAGRSPRKHRGQTHEGHQDRRRTLIAEVKRLRAELAIRQLHGFVLATNSSKSEGAGV